MLPVDGRFILKVAPRFSGARARQQERIVSAISGSLARLLEEAAIDTPLRVAHFMAQATHESAGFRTTEEFADGSAYEGRKDLGNVLQGDGPRFKGRGLLQLTGRNNYRAVGRALGLPLEDEPEIAADPVTSLRIACYFWRCHRINVPADKDDLAAVTRIVNGGLNGLAERRLYLERAKAALARLHGDPVTAGRRNTPEEASP